MMNYTKIGTRNCRPRAATLSLCLGILAMVYTLQATNTIASVKSSAAKSCADWAHRTFYSPSPDRDEAFIDCIVERDSSAIRDELRHKLATGYGDGLFDRLMTGEDLPITASSDCPYLRVAVRSPVGSIEAEQKPMRDLFSTALSRAGFKVVDPNSMHHWWASSLTLDTGNGSSAWTILLRAVPEIGNGAIQFTSVRKTVNGREGSFSGIQSLRSFSRDDAPEAARLAAEGIAEELLPAAHRRCGDIGATLEAAQVRLEELRNELTEEIERVRREKARHEKASSRKQLSIEVEG